MVFSIWPWLLISTFTYNSSLAKVKVDLYTKYAIPSLTHYPSHPWFLPSTHEPAIPATTTILHTHDSSTNPWTHHPLHTPSLPHPLSLTPTTHHPSHPLSFTFMIPLPTHEPIILYTHHPCHTHYPSLMHSVSLHAQSSHPQSLIHISDPNYLLDKTLVCSIGFTNTLPYRQFSWIMT